MGMTRLFLLWVYTRFIHAVRTTGQPLVTDNYPSSKHIAMEIELETLGSHITQFVVGWLTRGP